MTEGRKEQTEDTAEQGRGDVARDNEENELEAERESAEAMDADVPQPRDASQTTAEVMGDETSQR
jgi:hypothetical protein